MFIFIIIIATFSHLHLLMVLFSDFVRWDNLNNSFTFLVSTFTFFQSWFLMDGYVLFFLVMFFFINSKFFLPSQLGL